MLWLKKYGAAFALCALAGLVFLSYTRPDFIVNMANQIWLCF